ncbi:MAG: class I SAM-dependent methyltransferase, partial [Pseudomonadota bacterium]
LAKACPGSRFTALDISDVQIGYARRAAGEVTSLSVLKGDYHDLSRFADASIDLAFIVEALCYSQRKEAVFREVARILKPGGQFLVYDGYGEPPIAARSSDEARAARLLERGMAVDHFETFEDVRDAAESAGLDLAADQDFSAAILPTCDRFARRARRFLRHRLIAWIALRAFPPAFTNNVVVGLLFPILMRRRIFTYRASLFRKPSVKEDRTRS